MRLSVLVIDLDGSDLRELLEIQTEQIGDIELLAFRRASACQINICHTIIDLQPAVTGESVIDADPAVKITLGGTRSLKVFVESALRLHIAANPAFAGYFDRRQACFITHLVRKVDVDQCVRRSSGG